MTAPFKPPRPPVAHPVPFASGVEVSPRPSVGVEFVSAGFGVLTAGALLVVRGAGEAVVVVAVAGGCPKVKVGAVVETAVVGAPNNPDGAAAVSAGLVPNNAVDVGAVDVGAAGVVPNRPPEAGAEAAAALAKVSPKSPPGAGAAAGEVVDAGVPNKPPLATGAAVAAVVGAAPKRPPVVAVVAAGAAPKRPVVAVVVGAVTVAAGTIVDPPDSPLVKPVEAGVPNNPADGAAVVVAVGAMDPKSPPVVGAVLVPKSPPVAGGAVVVGFAAVAVPKSPGPGAVVAGAALPKSPVVGAEAIAAGAAPKRPPLGAAVDEVPNRPVAGAGA